ncbi:hypothetical protein M758_10G064100 [Ceratodon purpureus]|nr:hypothetical protein M758_10G064100 [Ceratodon purpureus]
MTSVSISLHKCICLLCFPSLCICLLCFSERQANIIYRGSCIGSFGIVNPEVMQRFDITDPCFAVEMNVEPFLQL